MTRPVFFDTHAHLDFPDFADEIDAIITRAAGAGITRIISVGTTLERSLAAISIAEKYPQVYAAVGWHPSDVSSAPSVFPTAFSELAQHPKVVAIGETGLDFSRLPSASGGTAEDDACYKERQLALFTQQLELAAEHGLNVVIHQRAAFQETLGAFSNWSRKVRAVFHCFVGTPAEQKKIRALGSLVSFTGIATFKNAAEIRETIRETALGEFMLETDAPYLAPVPHRGKRCEPAFVAETAAFIAREKGCTLEELSEATCRTARGFFPKLQ
jgi:TatD DNase family protein